eukprot:TRINITY_DN359_c1_g1_i1.p1 TRINITY_DN359_c1_g1~~TRINITY_DN359_c1_g1_i1.p1  ORF type:complete len:280 (+),score=99.42 TRINITY_DN359_c1_g1_i1:53-841(+)
MPLARAAAAVLLATTACAAGSLCSSEGWREVWRDDFDGSAVDEQSWEIVTSHGDSKVRNACGTRDSVSVSGGMLVLTSDRNTTTPGCPYNYTTGAVISKDKRYWQGHTRVCVNAILPGVPGKAQGLWPAHWMMPNTDACWPTNGEIDIMEMINGDGVMHQTYHYSSKCGLDRKSTARCNVPTWNTQLHEYAVEYNATRMTFFVDGNPLQSITPANVTLFDVPYYALLQTAMGGPWPGPMSESTVLPVQHLIDSFVVAQPQVN